MRQHRIIQSLNRDLVLQAPLVDPDPTIFVKPKDVERWTFNLHGKPVDRIIIYLRSDVGCEFGVKTGGCTGCRHWRLGTAGQRVPLENLYIRQFMAAIEEHGLFPAVFCLYNEGNMLNPREIPSEQLLTIVEHLAVNGVQRLVLESRPEYITDAGLADLRKAAGEMEIEVGIGLESSNDFIRNELFLKAMTRKSYEQAIARLRRYDIRSLAYVILKPAFLNEAQATHDAIRTARYAFDVSTDAISFEPIGVEPYTVTDLMYQVGLFKPAWLWSVLKVARETHRLGEVRIGGFQFEPLPVTLPRNCDECTPRVLKAIDEYNSIHDLNVLQVQDCACYEDYLREVQSMPTEIDEKKVTKALRRFVETTRYPTDWSSQTPEMVMQFAAS